jgi:hypothetical protein
MPVARVQPPPPPAPAKQQQLAATLSNASTQPAADDGPTTMALPRLPPPAPVAARPAVKQPPAPPGPSSGSISSSGSFSGAQKPAVAQKPQTGGAPLKGVQFVLSGFVNPERAELREKVRCGWSSAWHLNALQAVKLGAVYHPNWEPGCTHLIAQFAHTPKAAEAHSMLAPLLTTTCLTVFSEAGGIVLSKEWLADCAQQKRRISENDFLFACMLLVARCCTNSALM